MKTLLFNQLLLKRIFLSRFSLFFFLSEIVKKLTLALEFTCLGKKRVEITREKVNALNVIRSIPDTLDLQSAHLPLFETFSSIVYDNYASLYAYYLRDNGII